jgi:trans-aconitate 2-methyltransferase
MTTRDWNAPSYERVSAPLEAMGREVLDRLELRGDERVLDAGCGTGRVTAALLDRLPDGEVLAVDASAAMVAATAARFGDRVDARVADLAELVLDRPVDAILSTATLHWVPDHDAAFARLLDALVPGGRLVLQCGGEGNIAGVRRAIDAVAAREPFADALGGWPGPWRFASPAETAQRLRRLGYVDVWTWRQHVDVHPEDPQEYLATVVLGSHLERLAPEHREPFAAAVLEAMDEPRIGYVRLNVLARRPGSMLS